MRLYVITIMCNKRKMFSASIRICIYKCYIALCNLLYSKWKSAQQMDVRFNFQSDGTYTAFDFSSTKTKVKSLRIYPCIICMQSMQVAQDNWRSRWVHNNVHAPFAMALGTRYCCNKMSSRLQEIATVVCS